MDESEFSVSEFWSHHEVVVNDHDELHDKISQLSKAALAARRTIAWRGQTDADWALTSKLYRELIKPGSHSKTETALSALEKNILIKLREWGLHSQKGTGRLSVLSQLAILQHYGAPTRLIDISFNALVAAFFATEQNTDTDEAGARIFAIDITDRIINENKYLREWEDTYDTPWSESFRQEKFNSLKDTDWKDPTKSPPDEKTYSKWAENEWTSHYYVWKPPALDPRIAAQNGGFLLGGVVGTIMRDGILDRGKAISSAGRFQVSRPIKDGSATPQQLTIEQLRTLTSVAVRPQSFPKKSMRDNSHNAVFSIRITSAAKPLIRKALKNLYGYSHSTIYPDFSGFATHWMKRD